MLKHFTTKFLRGFFALFPILLSAYILFWIFSVAETAARTFLLFYLPDQAYVPGLGILAAVALIYSVGNLLDRPGMRRMFKWIEEPFQIVPVVRSIYQAIKDFTSYLSPRKDSRRNRAVLVRLPGTQMEAVGLVTRESLQGLPMDRPGHIAVYLPMSYQFGGYTVFIPKDQVQELPMSAEEAMRSVLTAWVSGGASGSGTNG
jgi:uncharacterized membrane protein